MTSTPQSWIWKVLKVKKRGKRKRKGRIIVDTIIDLIILAIEEVHQDLDERKRKGKGPGLDQGLRMTKGENFYHTKAVIDCYIKESSKKQSNLKKPSFLSLSEMPNLMTS